MKKQLTLLPCGYTFPLVPTKNPNNKTFNQMVNDQAGIAKKMSGLEYL